MNISKEEKISIIRKRITSNDTIDPYKLAEFLYDEVILKERDSGVGGGERGHA